MNKINDSIEKWVLKKRSIWFHLIVGYFTIGMWAFLYFSIKIGKGKREVKELIQYNKNIKINIDRQLRGHGDTSATRSAQINYTSYYKNKEESLYTKTKTKKFVDDYVVFDLETTGFYPNEDKIIEIGALKYINNELVSEFRVLINPQIIISTKITSINGITNEMVKDCEIIDDVLPKFIDYIEDYTLIAHNGSFDLGFIEYNLRQLKLDIFNNKNIDTLHLARKYISETDNHKLETLKKHFKLKFDSHRALDDCYTTNYVYQYCKDNALVKQ